MTKIRVDVVTQHTIYISCGLTVENLSSYSYVSFCTVVYTVVGQCYCEKMTIFGLYTVLVMMFMRWNLGVTDVFNSYHSCLCTRK